MIHWFMSLSIARRTAVVYGIGFAVWLFGLELPAHFKKLPILTFSGDIWAAIKWWHPIALMIPFFFFVLVGHFDRGWSVLYLIGAAALILGAVVVHVVAR